MDDDPNKKKRGRKPKDERSEKEIIQSKIDPEAGLLSRSNKPKGFHYLAHTTTYNCPEGKSLRFSYISWHTEKQTYSKIYASQSKDCKQCPLRSSCFGKTGAYKTIRRPLFQEATKCSAKKTAECRTIQKARRVWCEGSFGTMKRCHNLAYTYKKGTRNATEHCLLSALALNIKRIVKVV